MIDKKDITGIILSGGKSSRMGSDKGFLHLNGKAFVQYSIDALKPLVSEIIIVSDHTEYDKFGYRRITDTIKNAGPVAGISAGLEASKTAYNLVLSCDIPLITSEILEKLIQNADAEHDIIQIESQGKTMPLIALYKKSCGSIFRKLVEQDERRLRVAVNSCKVKNVVLESKYEKTTMNVNTQEELKQLSVAFSHSLDCTNKTNK
ncbi:molybdenum cofactor guanylyltransferase [Tamlana sp. 2_MG-2023]|uniref:molybdenum cofactor guanylyltransferase n=1 Tax=unclassified Tamlana TaxID=2614803 RepID=UPI0026E1C8A5|nr:MULTISPECIES: molybdenum cofactor guanylyltransferase [unclassified Tamlana]MDO6758831.1 molybdenum cofactor guanylyltransferase [Tamlana sp. 2_MG-2023]MDO6789530.1 molybdenum cofactor guanylyltransferase [Tamlana sp. 1_MG-2023]